MHTVRQPAVSGLFYPAEAGQLHHDVAQYLAEAKPVSAAAHIPKAIIAPHAGYMYSGPVAASVYARLLPARHTIQRVILLGPSHRVAFMGIASSSAEAFATPLGNIPLDRDAIHKLATLPQVHLLDQAHSMEHSLEVHLPFLMEVLDSFTLVPLVVGDSSSQDIAEVLATLWGGSETLIVISSDLSHYHDYNTAKRLDRETSNAILSFDEDAIFSENACGFLPVRGLLQLAKQKALSAELVDLRNSGDTAGDKSRVVGYGAYAFFEQ
jgi:AmmeMemoRadiSam system protein B